jgi:hypothetical protein
MGPIGDKMKLIIVLIIALQFNFVSAQENTQPTGDADVCENVIPMAVLTKDNMPYWSDTNAPLQSKIACYDSLKFVANNASREDLNQIEDEYEGKIRFFSNDRDFAQFIKEHQTHPSAFVVEASTTSYTPVYQLKKTIFFQN